MKVKIYVFQPDELSHSSSVSVSTSSVSGSSSTLVIISSPKTKKWNPLRFHLFMVYVDQTAPRSPRSEPSVIPERSSALDTL